MNTGKCRVKFKNSCILLESGRSSMIVMVRLVKKLFPEKYYMMQWHTQAGNITTNLRVKVDFTLTVLSAMNIVTCKCHVDNSAKGRYNMILGQNI